jgi:hypothetical protein
VAGLDRLKASANPFRNFIHHLSELIRFGHLMRLAQIQQRLKGP